MAVDQGLCLTWSETPEDRFSRAAAHILRFYSSFLSIIGLGGEFILNTDREFKYLTDDI